MIKLLMLNLQKRVEQAKLPHDAEGSAMNGVAAEVAVKVLVLFEHDDIDSLTRKQESEHDAGRSSSDNTYRGVKSLGHWQLLGKREAHTPCTRTSTATRHLGSSSPGGNDREWSQRAP